MDPVTLALVGASLGGGLLQAFGGKKNQISPEWLKQHFGAGAVNQEMIDLFNAVINSPYGQQLMTSAAEQGQQFGRDTAVQAANAGFGPGGGADSGASIFAGGAAGGAVNALQRGVRGDVMRDVMPLAQQIVQSRMNAATQAQMQAQQGPSALQSLGGMLSSGANAALMAGGGQPAQAPMNMLPTKGAVPAGITPGLTPGSFMMDFRKKPGIFSRMFRPIGAGMQRMASSSAT